MKPVFILGISPTVILSKTKTIYCQNNKGLSQAQNESRYVCLIYFGIRLTVK